jgi:hypothetical protein
MLAGDSLSDEFPNREDVVRHDVGHIVRKEITDVVEKRIHLGAVVTPARRGLSRVNDLADEIGARRQHEA